MGRVERGQSMLFLITPQYFMLQFSPYHCVLFLLLFLYICLFLSLHVLQYDRDFKRDNLCLKT